MEIVPKNIFYFLASNFRKFIDAIFLGDVQGISNLPNPPFIIACNHISIPDGWLISGVMVGRFKMPAWFIVRDDFWWGRAWSNFVADRLGGLIIDWRKPREIIKKALNILSFGGIVGIFPEGTRNPNSKSLALGKTGVARIALGSGCPVIPVAYFGPSIATTMDGIKNFILKRNLARIVFGSPIYFSDYKGNTQTKEILYQVTDKIMVEIGKLCRKQPRKH